MDALLHAEDIRPKSSCLALVILCCQVTWSFDLFFFPPAQSIRSKSEHAKIRHLNKQFSKPRIAPYIMNAIAGIGKVNARVPAL